VVATGFDAAYYSKRVGPSAASLAAEPGAGSNTRLTTPIGPSDADMDDINMELDTKSEDGFGGDTPMPNIWAIDEETDDTHVEPDASDSKEHDSVPSNFSSNDNFEKPFGTSLSDQATPIVSSHMEDELEKPSFLRRLTKRKKDDAAQKDNDKSDNSDTKKD
jgi:hypothetical protein